MANDCKIHHEKLSMIITERCTLNCAHCIRDKKNNIDMCDEVMEATLDQIGHIDNLCLGGGEITLVCERIEKLFYYLIKKRISLYAVQAYINATIYEKEFIRLFNEINDYIRITSNEHHELNCYIFISADEYHTQAIKDQELEKRVLENRQRYVESDYFAGYMEIKGKVIREGRARFFPRKITRPIHIVKKEISYPEPGICNISGPACISTRGNITEPDTSYENMESKYNYGNVFMDSIADAYDKAYVKANNGLYVPNR